MNRLVEHIGLVKVDGSPIKWMDRIQRIKLIILDHFGLQLIAQQIKLILLQILKDRYENAATIICLQLPIAHWHVHFDEPTIVDAVLERIIPKAHRLEFRGKSLRK